MGILFGEYIKGLRNKHRYTLRQVEKLAGISNAYLSQIERGLREAPTLRKLHGLAKLYNVSLSTLTRKAEDEFDA